MNIETIKYFILLVWSFAGVKIIVVHTLLNVIFAVAASIKIGDFQFKRITEFLGRKLLPYVMCYFPVALIGSSAGLDFLAAPLLLAIETALTADLLDNIGKLGLKVPEGILKLL